MRFKITFEVEVSVSDNGDDSRVQVCDNGSLWDGMTGDTYPNWTEYWQHQVSRDSSFQIEETAIVSEDISAGPKEDKNKKMIEKLRDSYQDIYDSNRGTTGGVCYADLVVDDLEKILAKWEG